MTLADRIANDLNFDAAKDAEKRIETLRSLLGEDADEIADNLPGTVKRVKGGNVTARLIELIAIVQSSPVVSEDNRSVRYAERAIKMLKGA